MLKKDAVTVETEKSLIMCSLDDIRETIENIERYVKMNRKDEAKTCAINLEEQSKELRREITGWSSVEKVIPM